MRDQAGRESTAFFQFAAATFDGQEGLATADGAQLTLNSATKKAGLDWEKVADCAKTPATSDEVEKSVKLAEDLNITSTPTLMINGRQVSIAGLSYDKIEEDRRVSGEARRNLAVNPKLTGNLGAPCLPVLETWDTTTVRLRVF